MSGEDRNIDKFREAAEGVRPSKADMRPWEDLALTLRNSVYRWIDDPEGMDKLDVGFQTALQEVAGMAVEQALSDLPPEEVIRICRERLGDQALAESVATVLGRKTWEANRADQLAKTAHERSMGRLDLTQLPKDEMLVIGMFISGDNLANYGGRETVRHLRDLVVRTLEPSEGLVELVKHPINYHGSWTLLDHSGAEVNEALWSMVKTLPSSATHLEGKIGTKIQGLDIERFEPLLSTHGPITYKFGQYGEVTSRDVIGYVMTHDGQVLIEGSPVQTK